MERLIHKLDEAALLVEAGVRVAVSKATPVVRLALKPEEYSQYLLFLLRYATSELQTGRSLSWQHTLPLQDVTGLLKESIVIFEAAVTGSPCKSRAEALHDRIFAIRPGWRRVWAHATRRVLPDADLLLAEWSLWSLTLDRRTGYNAYESTRFFLSTYEQCRFQVPRESAPRWRAIHGYWKERLDTIRSERT